MKQALLIAGACALSLSGAAIAKPGNGHDPGYGKGNNPGMAHSTTDHSNRGKHQMYGYGNGGCPPGLANKNNGCMPPGQFKRLYSSGQRFPQTYGNLWSYNQIPYDLRSQYGFRPNYRYYYGDGYLYQVDPKTMLVQQVVNAIMR